MVGRDTQRKGWGCDKGNERERREAAASGLVRMRERVREERRR